MAQLWDVGVRGTTLDVFAAWKEALLLVALVVVAWHVRHFPPVKAADVLAVTYAAVIVVYWAIPQGVLGGEATARGELLALRITCSRSVRMRSAGWRRSHGRSAAGSGA